MNWDGHVTRTLQVKKKSSVVNVKPIVQRLLEKYRRTCGPGRTVGIATGYWLDGPGIDFR
jgi:hypothetical protein